MNNSRITHDKQSPSYSVAADDMSVHSREKPEVGVLTTPHYDLEDEHRRGSNWGAFMNI
ncbi:hypothetical protein IWQ60_008866, partial [Tieghemiomyces parasiticus]